MNVRGLVRELLVAYCNQKRIKTTPIREFVKEYKGRVPANVDLYRTVYHIATHDEGFRVESDGDMAWVVVD